MKLDKAAWFVIWFLLASVCISQAKAKDDPCWAVQEFAAEVMAHRQYSDAVRSDFTCREGPNKKLCVDLFDVAFSAPVARTQSEKQKFIQAYAAAWYTLCLNESGKKA